MYQEFFSLKTKPFSISPDPNFLFLSDRHKEAIAHMRHGLQSHAGFVLLTGEVGTGKTTICRSLIENMDDDINIASILNPALSNIELLSTICDSFNIEYQNSNLSSLFDALKGWMIDNSEKNRHTLVIIDEAQHLSFEALDLLCLLTNIKHNDKKPLQVILIGQTELQEKLKQTEFRQLAQRISARYHLLSLSQKESYLYIQHRLNISGSNHAIFDKSALQEVFRECSGTPRLTNILCDRSLLAAYTQGSHIVTLKMVKQASKEVHFTHKRANSNLFVTHWRLTALIFMTLLTAWQAPTILQRFNSSELVTTINKNIAQIAPGAITAESEQWFHAYPQLDLTLTSHNDALSNLYAIWGYQVDSDRVDCDKENSAKMTCYSNNLNLQQLKQLNYPSVVRLQKDKNNALYAVIYRITDDYQLLIGDNLISVSEAWFTNYWSGEITTLWQPPFALKGFIKYGHEGDEVSWLANQLNKQQGWPSEHKTSFDLHLLEQVVAFQREQGLMDDGVVGPRTLMPLMHLAVPNTPRLLQEER